MAERDITIGLKLLWGRQEAPTRGPKPGLTLDRIVAAGVAVADEHGLGAVSMRAVAKRLGVGAMSLYRYVPGKAELLDLMLEAALGEQPPVDPSAPWRAQLEHFAQEGMALYLRHPWMLGISVNRPPLGPNTIGNWDALLQALTGIGLSGPDVISAGTAVGAYLRGAAQSAVEAQQGESDEEWWGARMSFWEDFFEPDRFPALTALWESGGYEPPRDDFAFGLARLLDGIEAHLARGPDLPPSEA